MNAFTKALDKSPWVWSLLGVVALWGVLGVSAGHLSLAALAAVAGPAAFLVFVSIGQSFAMVTGPGNVDLSIPSVITLSAFTTINLIGGADAMALPGLIAGLMIGALVGAVNAFLIIRLRIPAIIATLATGYIVTTFSLLENREQVTNTVAPILRFIATGRMFGLPMIAVAALVVACAAGVIFHGIGFGRLLLATGQNQRAAALAGIPTGRVVTAAFLISGGLAGLAGVLLAANAGGAFLDIGTSYLLQSIGAVVIGGSPIFGGRVTVIGTVLGALFLTLLGVTMQVIGVRPGTQEVVQGLVIISVLAASGIRLGTARATH